MYGTDWMNVLYSASFSVARCKSPTCGSTRSITSPSSSSTRRSTPCAAGCCGPKFMVKLRSVGPADGATERSLVAVCNSLFAIGLLPRLLIARKHVARPLPWREKLEFAEFLGEPHRLVDDPLLLVVVADLHEAGEWKVLAQRMAFETVIGQQPPQIGMAAKRDSIEIVDFPLEPIGAGKHADDRGHRGRVSNLELHAHARVLLGRKKMINDVEAPFALRPIDRGNIDQAPELAAFVVAQERREGDNVACVRR